MAASALIYSALTTAQLLAGGECRPPKDSSEAKLLAWFTAPIAFSPAGHTERLAPGAVRLSFEVSYVPAPGSDISRATYCRRKSETTDLSPVLPRPRVAIGLPGGFFVEGSYLPPVKVMDATPNFGSVALGWSLTVLQRESGSSAWVTLRAHATMGEVRGAITCSKQALQIRDNRAPCYGITPSDDRYEPRMVGGELAIGWRGTGSISAYLGGGYTDISPRLQVNFQPGGIGFLDNTRVLLDDSRLAAFAGGSWRVTRRAAVTAEVYSVPKDLTTVRVGGSWQLRRAS